MRKQAGARGREPPTEEQRAEEERRCPEEEQRRAEDEHRREVADVQDAVRLSKGPHKTTELKQNGSRRFPEDKSKQ